MELKQLFQADDDRAVSPVIGVILMVAITVILAAVIGTFVLGLGDSVDQAQPNAQIGVDISQPDASNLDIDINHRGGDRIDTGAFTINVRGGGATATATEEFDSGFSVGDTQSANIGTNTGTSDDVNEITVQIIHTPTDSIQFERTFDLSTTIDESDLEGTTLEFNP